MRENSCTICGAWVEKEFSWNPAIDTYLSVVQKSDPLQVTFDKNLFFHFAYYSGWNIDAASGMDSPVLDKKECGITGIHAVQGLRREI